MRAVKRAAKACLRPVYRGLVKPLCRAVGGRLRDCLVPEQAARALADVQAQLGQLSQQLAAVQHQLADLLERHRQLAGAMEETDRLVLALLKSSYLPSGEDAAAPSRVECAA